MFYSKCRHMTNESIIDISSIQSSSCRSLNICRTDNVELSTTHMQNNNRNQNRVQTRSQRVIHRPSCHSTSDDSLNREFIHTTHDTLDRLFLRTNFDGVLDEIQLTLQPIVEQLREQIERKRELSKHDRVLCMKSCARFITETLIREPWIHTEFSKEFDRLRHILDRVPDKHGRHVAVQTQSELAIDMNKLRIDTSSMIEMRLDNGRLSMTNQCSYLLR
jgi:hypothetical protein